MQVEHLKVNEGGYVSTSAVRRLFFLFPWVTVDYTVGADASVSREKTPGTAYILRTSTYGYMLTFAHRQDLRSVTSALMIPSMRPTVSVIVEYIDESGTAVRLT